MINNMFYGLQLMRILRDKDANLGSIRVDISLTSACNYRCKFCRSHSRLRNDNIAGVAMDTATAKALLESLYKLHVKNIIFAGNGEPFLSDDLIPLIREYGDKFNIDLLTNGSLLGKLDMGTFMKLKRLTVSINSGTGKSHQEIHGYKGKGQWDGIIRQIDRFGKGVKLNYVITDDNRGEVDEFRRLAASRGLKTAIRPTINEIAPSGQLFHCYQSFIQSLVDSDGDVLLCSHGKDKPMGNLHTRSFEDIWKDEKNIEFRARAVEMKEPIFKGCINCSNVQVNSVPFYKIYSKLPKILR